MVRLWRFAYQDLRGLRRSFSLAVPVSRSQVHLTSLAVNGLPSCHLTPWRSGKVSSVPSSFHDHPVARSGTTDCRLVCATSCLYMTRLLKIPIAGCRAARVDSSRMDMLAGLSKCESLRIPPCFGASVGEATNMVISIPPAAAKARKSRLIFSSLTSVTRVPGEHPRPNLLPQAHLL